MKVLGEAFHLGLAGTSQPRISLERRGARVEGEAKLDCKIILSDRFVVVSVSEPANVAVKMEVSSLAMVYVPAA